MNWVTLSIVLCTLVLVTGSKPHESGGKDRAYDRDLSDVDHHEDGDDHDTQYDHEAILGKEEAKKFDELTPEESRARLGSLVDKMDKDGDGKVSTEELRKWISDTSRQYLFEDRDRQWKEYASNDEKITWDEYKTKSYGEAMSDGDDLNTMKSRDERRWKAADKNGDGSLDKDEFLDFLHPEEAPHMKAVVIQETMADIDKNGDGKIDMKEYIPLEEKIVQAEADMHDENGTDEKDRIPKFVQHEVTHFNQVLDKDRDGKLSQPEIHDWLLPNEYERSLKETLHLIKLTDLDQDMWSGEENEEEPEWLNSEREAFKTQRDKNGDGVLSAEEIEDWILPKDYDHVDSETKHLFSQADVDGDGFLTKEEILNKYDIFVGSQATDFGEALTRHTEL